MQDLLRWLASLRGVALEPGTELRLQLSAFPGGGLALVLLVGAAAVLVLIAAVYRRDAAALPWRSRLLLAALRGTALLAGLLVLLEPSLVAVKREDRPGQVILLLDVSQSMSHRDTYRRDEVAERRDGWQAVGIADPASATRLELAKAALLHDDQRLLRLLSARNQVRAYGFASGVQPIAAAGDAPALDLAPLAADGRYTDLGGAVRAALEHSRDAAVAGVILLTDGRRNVGLQGAEVARLLAQRKVAHTLVLPVGDPSETQTVQLTRVEAPERVFQRDPFRVRAHVAAPGYDVITVEAELFRESDGGSDELIARASAEVGGATEAVIEFDSIVPGEPGPVRYRVDLRPPPGEPRVEERHIGRARVEVLSEQTRLLLIAGGPSYEYRFLRTALTRDKTIDLSCWLTSADPNFAQDGDTPILALPEDRSGVEAFDVFILLDPDATKLPPAFATLAAEHVQHNGAGLWWVCGEKYSLDALRPGAATAPLAALLPVEPDLARADREIYKFGHGFHRQWPWELTPEGRTDKLTALFERDDQNAALWPALPGYCLAFPILRTKPAAIALVRITSPLFAQAGDASPLLAYQFLGAGRVLFTGTDETYRWRSLFETAYHRFWVKGIRFLHEGRLAAGNSRLRLRVSEDAIELGDAVKVLAEATDDGYQPMTAPSLELTLTRQGHPPTVLRLERVDESPGDYAAVVRPLQTGFYTVARQATAQAPAVEVSFQVMAASTEEPGPADLAELATIASAPGGRLLATPQALLEAAGEIPSRQATETYRTRHALWDTWVTVALVLGLLTAEWWLRKRFNLL